MAAGARENIVCLGGKMFSQSKDNGFGRRHQRPITMAAGSIVRLSVFRTRAENLVDSAMERRFQIAFELRRYEMGVRAENRVHGPGMKVLTENVDLIRTIQAKGGLRQE